MIPTTHPLELVFDLELGSTAEALAPAVIPQPNNVEPSIEVSAVYDARDVQIDTELEQIRVQAIELATTFQTGLEFLDPKQLPRVGEVTIQALQAALDAVKQKSVIKQYKDRLTVPQTATQNIHNTSNTVVIDRRELLRQPREMEIIIPSPD